MDGLIIFCHAGALTNHGLPIMGTVVPREGRVVATTYFEDMGDSADFSSTPCNLWWLGKLKVDDHLTSMGEDIVDLLGSSKSFAELKAVGVPRQEKVTCVCSLAQLCRIPSAIMGP